MVVSPGDQYRDLCHDALMLVVQASRLRPAGETPAPQPKKVRQEPRAVPEEPADAFELEQQVVEQIRGSRRRIDAELSKVIVGQADVIEQLMISLFAGGHCLITGAPGLAKTLLVRSIAQIFELQFRRIQVTPDLMPADRTGTRILEQMPHAP